MSGVSVETVAVRSESSTNCLGADLFGGHSPDAEAPPAELRAQPPGTVVSFARAHRRSLLIALGALAAAAFLLVIVPQVAGFGDTLDRLRSGDKAWLALGVGFEVLSLAGYIAVFRAVFSCHGVRIDWRASYQITMAGVVATKLLAAAGAGGIALTAWALRASGLSGRTIARRMAGFEVLLYGVYMAALLVDGVGLASGVLPGPSPLAPTLIPAAFGALVIVLALVFLVATRDVERHLHRLARRSERWRRVVERLEPVPVTIRDGLVMAASLLRRPRPGLLGAVAYWAFDIATLWAAFRAFGAAPAIAVVVMGYFVGTLFNVIPIPGGIGGVEGGMIGAFLAFGVDASSAVLAVLAYRAISFWLPLLPGAVAYLRLRQTVSRWREAPGAATPFPAAAG